MLITTGKSPAQFLLANPKPVIKLALFDVDGTLLNVDGNYTHRVQASIARVRSMGVKTAVASGRPYFATRFLWQELGLVDVGVYCTGAQIYQPSTGRLHRAHPLPTKTRMNLLAELRRQCIYYELYTETGLFVERNLAPEILAVHSAHLRSTATIKNFDEVVDPAIKMLVGVDLEREGNTLVGLEKSFPECIFAYARLPAYPNWLFASIIHVAASKRAAFNHLLEHYNIGAENVVSFGDAQSDIEFITMAGVGVAMGNATDDVKSIANITTAPVWDDGIADVLDILI
jgi:Cof subfamily protein (haloacid dehalogenase superfamily)